MKDNRLHIMFLSSLYPRGSDLLAGIFVHNQAKVLRNYGCEILVVSPIAVSLMPVGGLSVWKNLRRIKHEDILDGIKVFYPRYLHFPKSVLGKYSFFVDLFFIKKTIQSAINAFKPDILHVHTATPDGVIGLLIKQKVSLPLVITLRGSDINVDPFRSKLIYRLTKLVLSEADKVIAVSNALKQKAEEIASPREQISVIHDGCEKGKFDFNKAARLNMRKKLNISEKSTVFIFVGNVLKMKGIFELLDAFYLLINKIPDIYLIFVGGGRDAKVIIKKAVKTGIRDRTIFVGYRPHAEIPHWLSMADVLVLPSYSEGMPTVIVEAMACQRAIIATRVGGIPEAIIDGQSGILVEPRDSVTLMKAMEKLARDKDLRLKMGIVGRQIVAKQFSWHRNIRKLIDIYKSIIM